MKWVMAMEMETVTEMVMDGDGDGDGNGNGDGNGDGEEPVDPEQPSPTPNPNGLELQYSSKTKEVIIKNQQMLPVKNVILYNALGQEIHRYNNPEVKAVMELPIVVPSKGMYFIRVLTEESTLILKFLVD